MIFQRALRRELVSTGGAVFMALFTITLTVTLIRILGKAAGGQIASADVFALIGFAALNLMPIILTISSFIAVLLVVTRSYQDSEMVVWFASGMSLTQWIRPVMRFGFPIVLMTAALSFVVTPWADGQSNEFKERFEKRNDIEKVSPGTFQESASANRVFFVEGVSSDLTKMKNVFVQSVTNDRTSLVVAKEASIEYDKKGDKFLVLDKGMRYDSTQAQADMRITQFDRYSLLVSAKAVIPTGDGAARWQTTLQLLNNPTPDYMGELLWRIALPVMNVLLMLLAIPLGFVNPRVGRSVNLLIALLLYVTYSNMVSYVQTTVSQGKSSFSLTWWPMHFAVGAIIFAMFLWRLNVNSRYHPLVVWSLLRRLRSRRSEVAS